MKGLFNRIRVGLGLGSKAVKRNWRTQTTTRETRNYKETQTEDRQHTFMRDLGGADLNRIRNFAEKMLGHNRRPSRKEGLFLKHTLKHLMNKKAGKVMRGKFKGEPLRRASARRNDLRRCETAFDIKQRQERHANTI